jgi:hypothetical protein
MHFHLLDGYLDPDYGSSNKVCKSNIEMMNNLLEKFKNDILNKIKIIYFNKEELISLSFDNSKYNIIQILYDDHATTFVYFVYNNKLNFLFFNSGKGIILHEKYLNMYLPYFGYSVDNIMNNKKYYDKIINVIILYDNIKNYNILHTYYKKEYIEEFKKNFENLINGLDKEKIKKINEINLVDCIFENFIKLIDKILSEDYDQTDIYSININIEYYNFIKIILDIIFEDNKFIYETDIIEYENVTDNLTNILFPDKSKHNQITKHIINKIKFYFNKKIYINTQESGSCVWFSLYWPILFYFIIYNKYNEYYEFINTILNKCIELINETYNNSSNYIKLFKDNLAHYFKFCDLCYKFININLVNNDIIEQNNYYNLIFKLNISWNITYKYPITYKNINDSLTNIMKFDTTYIIYINILLKEIKKINRDDSSIIFQYLFDLYIKKKNIELFKKNLNINEFENSLNRNIDLSKNEKYYKDIKSKKSYFYDNHLYIYLINLIKLYNNNETKLHKGMISYYYISKILFDINQYDTKYLVNFTFFLLINIIIIKLLNDIIEIEQYNNITYKYIIDNFIKSIISENYNNKIYDNFLSSNNSSIDMLNISILSKYYDEYLIDIYNYKYIDQYINIDLLDIDIFIKFDIYLLNNIKLVYKDNDNFYLFIKSYIKYINLNENIKIKNDLLSFYIERIYEYIKSDESKYTYSNISNEYDFDIYIYVILGILLNLNLKNDTKYHKVYFNIFDNYDMTLTSFILIIYKIYNSSLNFDEFYNKLLIYKFSNIEIIDYINDKYYSKNYLTIENIYDFTNDDFNMAFNLDYAICKFLKKLNDNELIIIIIYYDNSIIEIKFNYEIIDYNKNIILNKIIHIKYNNNEIIKYENILLPFKYIIPKSCPFYIYNQNNIYYVLYLINITHYTLSGKYNKDMLGLISIEDNKIILEINKNNNLFITNKLDIFINLCLNFGINNFNKIFINKKNIKENNKLYYKVNNYYFDKKEFLLKNIDELKYYKFEYDFTLNKGDENKTLYYEQELLEEAFNQSFENLLYDIGNCDNINEYISTLIDKIKIINNQINNFLKKKEVVLSSSQVPISLEQMPATRSTSSTPTRPAFASTLPTRRVVPPSTLPTRPVVPAGTLPTRRVVPLRTRRVVPPRTRPVIPPSTRPVVPARPVIPPSTRPVMPTRPGIVIPPRRVMRGGNFFDTSYFFNFNFNFDDLHDINNLSIFYYYFNLIKIKNYYEIIIKNKDKPEIICGLLKIYRNLFKTRKYNYKYSYEILFEIFYGNEISEEQFNIYINIINNYSEYNREINKSTDIIEYEKNEKKYYETQQTGSGIFNYPLYHIKMGKGKSSVITPLLTLYFILVLKKIVYIIVPQHLKNQTKSTMYNYEILFDIEVIIRTDFEIKKDFLNGHFSDIEKNKDIIFLIDEFDSLLDPTKSTFNLIDNTDYYNINNLISLIYDIIITDNLDLEDLKILTKDKFKSNTENDNIQICKFLIKDIKKIKEDLDNNKLIENINWGIHPEKCYVIPYSAKDTPALTSNFSSCILTIYLTLYYYLKYEKQNLIYIFEFIKKNNIINDIFNITLSTFIDIFKDDKIKKNILIKILEQLTIPKHQYNLSFIDIINIFNIYKIGYSGTMNIILPELQYNNILFNNLNKDPDEYLNVKYAIIHSQINISNQNIINENINDILNMFNISSYDALIDTIGLFKDIDNNIIANTIHKIINTDDIKRDLIYLDKNNNKLVIINNTIINYNDNDTYENIFIYYSQSHIVGIDINQNYSPILTGLCIINKYSLIEVVAQAMYRLRKLNMGHKIIFMYIDDNTEELNNQKLYELLKNNSNRKLEDQILLLKYQTFKA